MLRTGGAIVLDTLAFSVWNIGTRSPAAVWRDVRAMIRERRPIVAGLVRCAIGTVFLAAGFVLIAPAIANPPADFAPAELFVLLVALALEHLIGADIRLLSESGDR